ncbi:hypothetical protein EVAR_66756_1 [Eumeta japonica]|uniref:Uncharacterized protein n=1 Tax=Eumeta variegata TaxID=151549 RepID=A0A4C1Z9C2_EUMVA|nr:hypothetical protein EVAR_66756_1 [Eumeta japonica]
MQGLSKMKLSGSVKGNVLLVANALVAADRTYVAVRSSTEGRTDRASLRFIQSNLQRNKLATTELLTEAERRNIANMAKAWADFGTAMDVALIEHTLTVEIVKFVGLCNQLDENVETYTERMR